MAKKEKTKPQSPSENTRSKKRTKSGSGLIRTFFLCGMLLVSTWLIKITVWDSGALRANEYNPRIAETEKQFIRGSLLDCNGKLLAYTDAENTELRLYPYGESTAHVTGYVGMGKTGLEQVANSWLLQPAGFGETIKQWIGEEKIRGYDVVTTIDAELQQYIYDLLDGYQGAVVVSEPSTGKILALVSSPSYNPETVETEWEDLTTDESSPLYARATQGLYPPGSTFKIITALAYYRSTKDPYAYEYTCTGSVTIDNSTLHCSHNLVHGTQTIREAFANSCNCFFAELGVALGGTALQEAAESLHMTETFAFDLPQSTSSVALNASSTSIMLGETAMGQGETVMTPFQLNMLTAAIANQGVLYQPYLIDRVVDLDGDTVEKFYPEWYGSLMTTDEAAYLEDLMEGVITIGTAPSLADERWQVWGKTGTAQVGDGIEDHSWFTGYAQIGDQERIAVTVLIENGGETKRAVPLARKVFEYFS